MSLDRCIGVPGQHAGSGCMTFSKGGPQCSSRGTLSDILKSKGGRFSTVARLGRVFAAGETQASGAQAALLASGRCTVFH